VTIPALRCADPACGHLVELHDLAENNLTRKACSVSTGPQATRCGCKTYTELPDFPQENH
jgi:hypothetical protein